MLGVVSNGCRELDVVPFIARGFKIGLPSFFSFESQFFNNEVEEIFDRRAEAVATQRNMNFTQVARTMRLEVFARFVRIITHEGG